MSPCMNFLQSKKEDTLARYTLCMSYSSLSPELAQKGDNAGATALH